MPAANTTVNISFVNQITHAGIQWHVLGEYTDGANRTGVLLWSRTAVEPNSAGMTFSAVNTNYNNSNVRRFLTNQGTGTATVWSHYNNIYTGNLWRQTAAQLNANEGGQLGTTVTDNYFILSAPEFSNALFFPSAVDRIVENDGANLRHWTRSALNATTTMRYITPSGTTGSTDPISRLYSVVPAMMIA
jgi:hypothetical protein